MKRFKEYKFLKSLGKGTYGEIYLTQKGNDPTLIATKIFDRKRYDKSEYLKTCLEKEIEILNELNHPYIVKIYGRAEDDSNYYIFMEYCNGGSLTEILKKYKAKFKDTFSLDISQFLMRQIISSIDYIHSKNIVHRDLKLDNILISFKNEDDYTNLNIKAGMIKIIDFGVATKLDPQGEASTVAGSPIYMDPLILKQHVRKENIAKYDERVDIWSLGAIFFQLLTGERLYIVKSIEELEKKVEEGDYFIPRSKIKYKEPISFLNGMLQYNTEDRFTITELMEHNFIVKEIKDFTNTDLSLISYKIDNKGLEINSKENDTIYRIFNSGDKGFNKIGNPQVIRKGSRHSTERERGYSGYGDIYGFNKGEEIKNVEGNLNNINNFKTTNGGNIAQNPMNWNNFNKDKNQKSQNVKNKNNINDNEKQEIKRYINGLLSEYKAAKDYFNKNGLQKQEINNNKYLTILQQYLQDIEKGNFMNYKALPGPISPEYIYGSSISKRDSVFKDILDKYKAVSNALENYVKSSALKYQQLDNFVFSLIKEDVMPKLNNDKQKLDELKNLIKDLELSQKNKWSPAPDLLEELEYGDIEEISFKGCVFQMTIKTTKKNYNSACNLIARLYLKINEKKMFTGDVRIINYGDFENEILWNLTEDDWNNLSNYFINVDFIYDNQYQQGTKIEISKLKEQNEINYKYQTKFQYNNGDTFFNFNIKVKLPEGKRKVTKGMKKVINVKKIFPPFEGKSPDTQNIPSLFRRSK